MRIHDRVKAVHHYSLMNGATKTSYDRAGNRKERFGARLTMRIYIGVNCSTKMGEWKNVR